MQIVGLPALGDAERRRGRKCVTELVEVAAQNVSAYRRGPQATQHHVLATLISVHMAISSSVLETTKKPLRYML